MKEKTKVILAIALIVVGVLCVIFRKDVASYFNIITASVAIVVSVYNLALIMQKGKRNFVKLGFMVFFPVTIVALSTFDLVSAFGHAQINVEIGILLILTGILLEVKNAAFGKDLKFTLKGMANLIFIITGLVIILFNISYDEVIMIVGIIVALFGVIKALIWYFGK